MATRCGQCELSWYRRGVLVLVVAGRGCEVVSGGMEGGSRGRCGPQPKARTRPLDAAVVTQTLQAGEREGRP